MVVTHSVKSLFEKSRYAMSSWWPFWNAENIRFWQTSRFADEERLGEKIMLLRNYKVLVGMGKST